MFELFDTHPDIKVQDAEYQRLLGFPREHVLEGRARELANGARDWFGEHGKPWMFARQTDALQLAHERLAIRGVEFSSKQLHDQFSSVQARRAILVAVSAGRECEEKARELWQDGKPDEYFFMEAYGSAVVEYLITTASGRICGWADSHGMVALPHYSPGYSGWDMSDQHKLWSLIRAQNGSPLPGELNVMDSGMLQPKKSMLAVFGVTADVAGARRFASLVPCENCSLPGCQYRRVPYKHALPQIEDVRRLHSGVNGSLNDERAQAPGLRQDAKYSIHSRALRKWSQERLELKALRDGSIEARFRYEGTTCLNMGQPLEFHYHVQLAPPRDDYRIMKASCAPAPGDTGHTLQCEYVNDAASLMSRIANETPLLGRPLEDVLTWERTVNPSGCYCDIERRTHKWGLVFEVIHYSLVQREKQLSNGLQAATLK